MDEYSQRNSKSNEGKGVKLCKKAIYILKKTGHCQIRSKTGGGMSSVLPAGCQGAKVNANSQLFSSLPKDVLQTLFLQYVRIEEWTNYSEVCRKWKACFLDKNWFGGVFVKNIVEKYIFSNLWSPNLLRSVTACSKVSVKVYLDISGSMNDPMSKDVDQTAFLTAKDAINDIATHCFHFMPSFDLHVFTHEVHKNFHYALKNQAELNTALGTINCTGETCYNFLESILKDSANAQRANKTYIISDMDINTNACLALINKIKAITDVANLQLEFVNVGFRPEPEFMKILEAEKKQGYLPYITFRNFGLASLPKQDSTPEQKPTPPLRNILNLD